MASSLPSNLTITFFSPYPPTTRPITTTTTTTRTHYHIRCGPRDNRGPLVKGRVLSTEAIQAVQSLKRNLNDDVISKTLSRLIKSDLIATFKELLRQDQIHLAVKVFSAVRSEYKPDLSQYAELVISLARNGMNEDIDRLICDLEGEGVIQCDDKGLVRIVKALISAERVESTVKIYGLMKRSGWGPICVADDYLAKVMSKGLRRLGEESVADEIDREFGELSRGVLDKVRV